MDFASMNLESLVIGAPALMFILITVLAMILGAQFSKAFQAGLKLGIGLIGVGLVINGLANAFGPAMMDFMGQVGLDLSIIDVGWAPIAAITWSSVYTLFFILVLVVENLIMIYWDKTRTLDVDIFNFWHLAIIGLLVMYYSNNIILATLLVIFLGALKLINSDLMKPTFNDLLGTPESNPTTTTHINFLLNPLILLVDKIIDLIFPKLDQYDFDAAALNDKVGFWGSKFAIGSYLGLFVGILGRQPLSVIFLLVFVGAASLELFSVVGSWLTSSTEPFSQGVTNLMYKRLGGKQVLIGIDWPFLSSRSEMWAVANILAPILFIIALILPGNNILPMAGVIVIGVTPALLVVCRGKLLRMIVIGTLTIPLFLWSGTAISPFLTESAQAIGAISPSFAYGVGISHSSLEGPVEKFLAILLGQAGNGFNLGPILIALAAFAVYSLLFYWYVRQMRKRNADYEASQAQAEE